MCQVILENYEVFIVCVLLCAISGSKAVFSCLLGLLIRPQLEVHKRVDGSLTTPFGIVLLSAFVRIYKCFGLDTSALVVFWDKIF